MTKTSWMSQALRDTKLLDDTSLRVQFFGVEFDAVVPCNAKIFTESQELLPSNEGRYDHT